MTAALLVVAVLICLAVIGYGVLTFSPFWSICAGLAGAAVLVVTLRGFPLFALAPVIGAAFLWGLATRSWLPDDFLAVFKFIGGNLAFDVPLVGAYLAAILIDSRRLSRLAIDEAVSGRRWWVEGSDRPSGPPPLRELEMIPSTRFFVLDQGPCSHLVAAGRQVALLMSATWKPGAITMDPDGVVLRSGQPYGQGTDDMDALANEVRLWLERLGGTGARVRGFLVVAPTSDELVIDVTPGEQVELVPAYTFSDTVGGWLAAQPYRLELAVMERLLRTAVPEFASDRAVTPEYGSGYGALRRRSRRAAPVVASAPAPEVEDDWADLSAWHTSDAPAWDSDSARQLAEWAAAEAPVPGPPVRSRPADDSPDPVSPAPSADPVVPSPSPSPSPDPVSDPEPQAASLFDWPTTTRPSEPSDEPLEFRNWPTIKPVPQASLAPLRFIPEPDWPIELEEPASADETPVEADDVAAAEPVAEESSAPPPAQPEAEPKTRSWRSRLKRAFEPVREPEPEPPAAPSWSPPPVFDDSAAGSPRYEALRSLGEPSDDSPAESSRYDVLRSLGDPSSFDDSPGESSRYDVLRSLGEPDAEPSSFALPSLDEPDTEPSPFDDSPAGLSRYEALPSLDEPDAAPSTFEAPRSEAAPDADPSPFEAPASRYDALPSFASHPWPAPAEDLAPPALPSIPAAPEPEPEPEPQSRRSRRKKEPEPAPPPPEREPRGWRSRRKREAEPAPPPAEPASNDPQQSRLWQAARALDPVPIDPILDNLEPRRPSRHSSEADETPALPAGPVSSTPADSPASFGSESDRLGRAGLFGSEPDRSGLAERPGLFGSEPDRSGPAERPRLFGSEPDRSGPAEFGSELGRSAPAEPSGLFGSEPDRPGLGGSEPDRSEEAGPFASELPDRFQPEPPGRSRRFAPEPTERPDLLGPEPAQRPGLFGSEPNRDESARPSSLFGSEPDRSESARPSSLFGSEPDRSESARPSSLFGSEPDRSESARPSSLFGSEPDRVGSEPAAQQFGSEPDRSGSGSADWPRQFGSEPAEQQFEPDRFGLGDRSDLFGLESADRPRPFGSEPADADSAARSDMFGADQHREQPAWDERRDQPAPDERQNRFRRFRPEPVESPSGYQPPDRSDRYADERPGQPSLGPVPAPGQVDFSRLRKFGRPAEEAGSHRAGDAGAAPEWATSNTWDDQQNEQQQQPEKRRGRRARKAEPDPVPAEQSDQPADQWQAEQQEQPTEKKPRRQPPSAEEPPAEKKSRRQQRRERKTQPDETEVWLSGLSSSEPMSWEARGPGRTAPNDGLGLAEDLPDLRRQPSHARGSLFEDDGEDTWNSPPPATDGDDWWEATPRRRRDGKD